jgi:hypothetical protein
MVYGIGDRLIFDRQGYKHHALYIGHQFPLPEERHPYEGFHLGWVLEFNSVYPQMSNIFRPVSCSRLENIIKKSNFEVIPHNPSRHRGIEDILSLVVKIYDLGGKWERKQNQQTNSKFTSTRYMLYDILLCNCEHFVDFMLLHQPKILGDGLISTQVIEHHPLFRRIIIKPLQQCINDEKKDETNKSGFRASDYWTNVLS